MGEESLSATTAADMEIADGGGEDQEAPKSQQTEAEPTAADTEADEWAKAADVW